MGVLAGTVPAKPQPLALKGERLCWQKKPQGACWHGASKASAPSLALKLSFFRKIIHFCVLVLHYRYFTTKTRSFQDYYTLVVLHYRYFTKNTHPETPNPDRALAKLNTCAKVLHYRYITTTTQISNFRKGALVVLHYNPYR